MQEKWREREIGKERETERKRTRERGRERVRGRETREETATVALGIDGGLMDK